MVKHWADNFLELTSDIDKAATNVFVLIFKAANRTTFAQGEEDRFDNELRPDVLKVQLDFLVHDGDINKYIDLAPKSGGNLKEAFEELDNICRKWFQDKGGNVADLRQAQLRFNECARTTHRELLHLDD